MRTLWPLLTTSLMISRTWLLLPGSMPLVGSSISMNWHGTNIMRIDTCWRYHLGPANQWYGSANFSLVSTTEIHAFDIFILTDFKSFHQDFRNVFALVHWESRQQAVNLKEVILTRWYFHDHYLQELGCFDELVNAALLRAVSNPLAADCHLSITGSQGSQHHFESCALACSIDTNEAKTLSSFDRKTEKENGMFSVLNKTKNFWHWQLDKDSLKIDKW